MTSPCSSCGVKHYLNDMGFLFVWMQMKLPGSQLINQMAEGLAFSKWYWSPQNPVKFDSWTHERKHKMRCLIIWTNSITWHLAVNKAVIVRVKRSCSWVWVRWLNLCLSFKDLCVWGYSELTRTVCSDGLCVGVSAVCFSQYVWCDGCQHVPESLWKLGTLLRKKAR